MLKHIPFYASLLGKELKKGKVATTSHVLVYGAIEAHSWGPLGKCKASDETIGAETGLTPASVQNRISHLKSAGWISVELTPHNRRISMYPLLEIKLPTDAITSVIGKEDGAITRGIHIEQDRLLDKSNKPIVAKDVKYNDNDVTLTDMLFKSVATNFPFVKERKTKKSDYEEMNKIHRLDGYDYLVIKGVIIWSQQSEFWQKNIRSVHKLRKQFDTLLIQAREWQQKENAKKSYMKSYPGMTKKTVEKFEEVELTPEQKEKGRLIKELMSVGVKFKEIAGKNNEELAELLSQRK